MSIPPLITPNDKLAAFERAMQPENFERSDSLIQAPKDSKPYSGIWRKDVHVRKQQCVVFTYLAPSDLIDPVTKEQTTEVRQRADWIYLNILGCFPNKNDAECHVELVKKHYPEFDYYICQMYAFLDIPHRLPNAQKTHDPRVDQFLSRYFEVQSESKDNHLERISKDIDRSRDEQERMRVIQERERERLKAGGDPADDTLTMQEIARQMNEIDPEELFNPNDQFATPKQALEHEGFLFGTDLVNAAKIAPGLGTGTGSTTISTSSATAFPISKPITRYVAGDAAGKSEYTGVECSDIVSGNSATASGLTSIEVPLQRGPDMSIEEFEKRFGGVYM